MDRYHIRVESGIWSTAVGYDYHMWLLGEHGETQTRLYRNISAASLRRFYRVAHSYMNVCYTKWVTWRQYARILGRE